MNLIDKLCSTLANNTGHYMLIVGLDSLKDGDIEIALLTEGRLRLTPRVGSINPILTTQLLSKYVPLDNDIRSRYLWLYFLFDCESITWDGNKVKIQLELSKLNWFLFFWIVNGLTVVVVREFAGGLVVRPKPLRVSDNDQLRNYISNSTYFDRAFSSDLDQQVVRSVILIYTDK